MGGEGEGGLRTRPRNKRADLFHSPFLHFFTVCFHHSLPFSDSIQTGLRAKVLALAQAAHLFKCPSELYKDAAASNLYLYIRRSAHATLSLFARVFHRLIQRPHCLPVTRPLCLSVVGGKT